MQGKGAKKKTAAPALATVKPTNLEEERAKFLRNEAHQPQFRYRDAAAAQAACRRHPPTDEYLGLAVGVLERVRARWGCESNYHEAVWGKVLTKSEADALVRDYLERQGLASKVRIRWSQNNLVTSFGSGCLNLVDRPGYYRAHRLIGLLDHEVGTHFTRAHNGRVSLRGKEVGPRVSGFAALATEEGIASLNTHQFFSDKALFQPALLYWSSWRASHIGFAQLNEEMKRYVDDAGRRWLECVRVKRGMLDCSAPGAFCKEQSTFDGIVRLLYHRRSPLLDWRTLHCAKVSLEQYETVAPHVDTAHAALVVPHFLSPLSLYRQRLDDIAEHNGLAAWIAPDTSATPLAHRPPAVRLFPLDAAARHSRRGTAVREGKGDAEEDDE